MIYYAGHGILDRESAEGFWLPANAEADSQVEWVPVSTVTRTLRASSAKHVLVIADSCYSGTLTRAAPAALQTGAERHGELERLSRKRARKALTSGGLEPVYDGGGDGHSVFTRALLEVLRQNREIIDGYQLYAKLRPGVIKNSKQTPAYATVRFAGDEDGDFLLVPTHPAPAPSGGGEPAAATAVELAFWAAVQKSDDPEDLRAYLERYREGSFAALARNRLKRLGRVAARSSDLAGAWKTDVLEYSNQVTDVHYAFDLKAIGERLVGKVAFVRNSGQRVDKGILDGQISENRFSFRTSHKIWRSELELHANAAPSFKRTKVAYSVFYYGTLKADLLHITRQDERGDVPEEFLARRVAGKSLP